MAVIYKKNAQNVYKIPLYRFFWVWWLLVVSLAVLSSIIGLVVSIKAVQFALWSLVCVLIIVRAYSLMKSVLNAKSIKTHIKRPKSRASYHKEPTCDDVSQSSARYSTHLCSCREGRRKPTLLHNGDRGKAPRDV